MPTRRDAGEDRIVRQAWRWCRGRSTALVGAAAIAMTCGPAEAHVKWFCGPVDVTIPPLALRTVLTPTLFLLGVTFMLVIAAGGMADAIVARWWPAAIWPARRGEALEEWLIRLGVGAYLLALGNNLGVAPWGSNHDGAILTPELLDGAPWLGWLHIATGLLLVSRRTCPIAALGLLAMYGVGIGRYGIFHMTDYAFFVGLAGYLALTSPIFDRRPDLQRWRVPMVAATVGFSLMWTAIEKFLYPEWTSIVLAAHPHVTMGLPIPFVTVTAGFVEFSVAFYLLVGRSLLRLDAAIVILVLLAAVPEFGALDTVGHLPLVAMLLVIVLHGPTRMQEAVYPGRAGVLTASAWTAALYCLSFATMMALYYGLQRAGTWP